MSTPLPTQLREAAARTNRRQVLAWSMIGLFFVISCALVLFGFLGQAIAAWISTMAFWIASRIEAARYEITLALLSAVEGGSDA